jgi:hypothetical protein
MCYVYGTGEVDTRLWRGNVRDRDHFEDLGVYGKLILTWIFNKLIKLAQDRDRW